jgi:hypothetical protein
MVNLEGKQRLKQEFRSRFLKYVEQFNSTVSTTGGDWVVKGFMIPLQKPFKITERAP